MVVSQLRAWLLRPTVVHRLPGRLRLRIPAIKQLGPAQQDCALLWRDLLESVREIESVEVNLTTGSALIRYKADSLTEDALLGLLNSVNRFVLRQWDRLSATPPAALPRVLKQLERVATKALRQRPVLDDDIEVPDDVWA
jgi:hypothetical protein